MNRKQFAALLIALLGIQSWAASARAATEFIIPPVSVIVLDHETRQTVAGTEALLMVQTKKGADLKIVARAKTDGRGMASFPQQQARNLKAVRIRFNWDEPGLPRRTMEYQFKAKKGGKAGNARIVKQGKHFARFRTNTDRGGDCRNLFQFQGAVDRIQIVFRQPDSYLACQDVKFKFANLDEIGQRNINKGKINFFSFDEDVSMGLKFFQQLNSTAQHPLVQDPVVQSYAENMIQRIVKASDMPYVPYQVRVIDADILNAFALPGGFVFVYRGLIEATENEGELAGVLAHEVAHVTSRHGTEGMTSAIGKVLVAVAAGEILAGQIKGNNREVKDLVRGLAMMGTQFWILGGTRKREAEADHLGATYAWKAGYNPRGLATFFDKLAQERGRKQTRLDKFFSDHPNDADRIAAVDREVGYFLPPKQGVVENSPEYLEVKRRLARMPPAAVRGQPAAQAIMSSFKSANESFFWEYLGGAMDQ